MVSAAQRAASKRNIKKAQAARKKKAKKSTRRRSPVAKKKKGRKRGPKRDRRRRTNKKPIKRGLLGKLGATIMAVGPPAVAGLEAGASTMGRAKQLDLNILSTLNYGFLRFINNMSFGIIGTVPFETAELSNKAGSSSTQSVGAGIPRGSLLQVMGTGLVMMVTDFAATFLTGNRETKVIGTNMTATGTR